MNKFLVFAVGLLMVFQAGWQSVRSSLVQQPDETPSPSPSPAATAAPLPGKEVIPLDKLGKTYPWLPLDKSARPSVYFFYFNLKKPPFDNLLVRQAFAAAVDREALVKAARDFKVTDALPATTYTPPQTLGRDLYGAIGILFDAARVKELLTQAGYADTSKFPTVTLLIGVSETDTPGYHEKIAEMITGMWKKHLGITVNVEKVDFNTYADRIFTDPPEIFRAIFYPGNNDPDDFLRNFITKTKFNLGGFSNPNFDKLIETAKNSDDPAVRQEEYIQAEKVLNETEAAILPIFHLSYSRDE